jgi:hypothetical protein
MNAALRGPNIAVTGVLSSVSTACSFPGGATSYIKRTVQKMINTDTHAGTPASTDTDTGGSFWAKAMQAFPPLQEPEPTLSAEAIELSNWSENRGALGIPDNGEFIGVSRWQRPMHYDYHETTPMEEYAAQREKLGVREAPQASAGNPRVNAHPFGTAAHTIRKEM